MCVYIYIYMCLLYLCTYVYIYIYIYIYMLYSTIVYTHGQAYFRTSLVVPKLPSPV